MVKEIFKITIKNFQEYVKIADKRQVKPFLKGKRKIPKRYETNDYIWDGKGRLINAKTGDIIASNPIVAGTERWWRINGQDIYNQKIKHSARHGIMSKLHEMFIPHLKNISKIENFPIRLELNFFILDNNKIKTREKNIDNDNKWLYNKVIQDTLTELGIIPDDNCYYINGNNITTTFVDDITDVKLEIIGYE